jgi:very-short-patch-repair endonuclease
MQQAPTTAEDALWQLLRRGNLKGYRFRRQHPVGRYLVDSYCPRARLAIEVDGEIHDRQVDLDEQRQRDIEGMGIAVVRFTNEQVLGDPQSVLLQIESALLERA